MIKALLKNKNLIVKIKKANFYLTNGVKIIK